MAGLCAYMYTQETSGPAAYARADVVEIVTASITHTDPVTVKKRGRNYDNSLLVC